MPVYTLSHPNVLGVHVASLDSHLARVHHGALLPLECAFAFGALFLVALMMLASSREGES